MGCQWGGVGSREQGGESREQGGGREDGEERTGEYEACDFLRRLAITTMPTNFVPATYFMISAVLVVGEGLLKLVAVGQRDVGESWQDCSKVVVHVMRLRMLLVLSHISNEWSRGHNILEAPELARHYLCVH